MQERRNPSCSTVRSPNRWWMFRRSFPYTGPIIGNRASERMLRCEMGICSFTETSPFPGSPAAASSGILRSLQRPRRTGSWLRPGPVETGTHRMDRHHRPCRDVVRRRPISRKCQSDEATHKPTAPQDVAAAAVLTDKIACFAALDRPVKQNQPIAPSGGHRASRRPQRRERDDHDGWITA